MLVSLYHTYVASKIIFGVTHSYTSFNLIRRVIRLHFKSNTFILNIVINLSMVSQHMPRTSNNTTLLNHCNGNLILEIPNKPLVFRFNQNHHIGIWNDANGDDVILWCYRVEGLALL